jgi:O-antigen ligase
MTARIRRIFSSERYITVVLATWIFAPELRRLYDFRTSYHQFSVFSLLPLLSLLPGLLFIRSDWPRLGLLFHRVAALWLLAFGYSFLVGTLSQSVPSMVYALAQAVVPLLFVLLLSSSDPAGDLPHTYERVASSLLWLTLLASLYGIFQYAAPPEWDVYWAKNADIESSQGQTVAFGFRIFGPLNSTAPFATCIALSILLNLPRMNRSRWWMPLMLAPQFIALILTLVRATWITFVIGLAVYILLSPRRIVVFPYLVATVLAIALVAEAVFALSNDAQVAGEAFAKRVQTFSDLGEDTSVNAREDQTGEIFRFVLREPLGQGLGAVGLSAKLGTAGEVLVVDNGYIARFLEMGFIGVAVFLAALALAFVCGLRAYVHAARGRQTEMMALLAVCLAVQLLFLIDQAGADSYFGSPAMCFWFALYVSTAYLRQSAAATRIYEESVPFLKRVNAAP